MGLMDRIIKTMGGHHGGKREGGHHGGSKHGGYGSRYDYPQSPTRESDVNLGNACPKCGSSNLTNARFCQQCGTSFVGGKCQNCGTELAAGAKFCSQCGKQP